MDDPREELRLLIGATRGLLEYTRDVSPEGAARLSPEELSLVMPQREPRVAQEESAEAPINEKAPPQNLSLFGEAQPESAEKERKGRAGHLRLVPPPKEPAQEAPRQKAPLPRSGGRLLPAKLPEVSLEERSRREALLEKLMGEVFDCTRCRLCQKRTQVVFGEGSATAPVMFIGEGPGEQEDRTGRPFVGAAGQLLSRIIQAMGFRREDVYIGNVVKCRPPGNRNPEPDEVAACLPYLEEQIQIVNPKVIVALGKYALQGLLGRKVSIMALRGKLQQYRGIPVMPTFHPAYILRNPESKRVVWEDMQEVRRLYEET